MKHHELNLIYALLALIFIIFSVAMVRLYREQMHLKEMVSTGLMQVKEEIKANEENTNEQINAQMMREQKPTVKPSAAK
jgi:predicted Holliday junction resolvase-like endonuclease